MPWWGIMILCMASFYAGMLTLALFVSGRDRDETDLSGL